MPWFPWPRPLTMRQRVQRLERTVKHMQQQVADLNQALADLKTALAEAADRIDAKLAELADGHPDLSAQIDEIRTDTALIAGYAAAPAPPPAEGSENPTA